MYKSQVHTSIKLFGQTQVNQAIAAGRFLYHCFMKVRNSFLVMFYQFAQLLIILLPLDVTDVHPKLKNKKAMKALIVLAFSLIGKFFSRDYSYVPTWQCLR